MDTIRACTPPCQKSPDNQGISGFSHTMCCQERVRNVDFLPISHVFQQKPHLHHFEIVCEMG